MRRVRVFREKIDKFAARSGKEETKTSTVFWFAKATAKERNKKKVNVAVFSYLIGPQISRKTPAN